MQCSSEELAEVILPCLVPSLTLWQYLSLRTEVASRSSTGNGDTSIGVSEAGHIDKSCNHMDLAIMLDEYAALHREVQNMCNEKLEIGPPEKAVGESLSSDEMTKADNATVAADVSQEPGNMCRLDADISDEGQLCATVDQAPTVTDAADTCHQLNSVVETEIRVTSADLCDMVSAENLEQCNVVASSDASHPPIVAELPSSSADTAECETSSAVVDAAAEQKVADTTFASSLPEASDGFDNNQFSSLTSKSDSHPAAVVVDDDLLQVSVWTCCELEVHFV
jgi:hypothetical protein